MGALLNDLKVPPMLELSETELELQHLKVKREEIFLEIERARQRSKDEEDKLEFLNERIVKEKDREDGLQRSIAEKHLVMKSLHLERERLEQDIRREQDHYDEVRKDKNNLLKDLAGMDDDRYSQERSLREGTEQLGILRGKLEEVTALLASVEDEIVTKVQQEKECQGNIQQLREEIQNQESALKLLKEESRLLAKNLEKEKTNLKLLQDKVSEEGHKEKTLKHLNEELRLELMRVEGKLADRRNSYHQLEFDSQELTRKIQDYEREIESKERAIQDNKRIQLKEGENLRELERNLKDFREQNQREKKHITENFNDDKNRQEGEINKLQAKIKELEDIRTDIAALLETERERIKDVHSRSEKAKKQKDELEDVIHKLETNKNELHDAILHLKDENQHLMMKKADLEYEVSLFNIKFLDNEAQYKQQQKDAFLEVESMKRTERSRISQERDSMLAEVESLKKKTLADIETNSDSVLVKARAEADNLVTKARLFEQDVMTKSQARMREANEEAARRDKLTFERFEEAEKSLSVLHHEYDEKKDKVKGHLHSLEEKGERHLRNLRESQENKLKKEEKFFLERLDQQKRREYKRVAMIRNEELGKREENLKTMQKEMIEKRKLELQKLARMKEKLHVELEAEKEKQQQEISQTKKNFLEQLRDSKRDKETKFEEAMRLEKENFEKTKKDRVTHAVSAVFHLVLTNKPSEGENAQNTDEFKAKIEEAISRALNGHYHETQEKSEMILDSNPLERKKILPVIGKYIFRFGLPAAAFGFVALDVGNIRTSVTEKAMDLLKQQKSGQDLFVKKQHAEWKQKYTFNPAMSDGYKASYTDNVLYTKDFVTVMEKEDFQNSWILALHDFIVNNLELSEEVAINYISAEGSMVKEMGTLRKDINPQFLDQGVNKLKELETKFEEQLVTRIPDSAKLEKFKEFRKKYYEEYVGQRNIASEKKP